MKKVMKYEATNGKVFDSELECEQFDCLLLAIEIMNKILGSHPRGHDTLQHDKEQVNKLIIDTLKLFDSSSINKIMEDPDFQKDPFQYRNSIIGRYFSDSDSPLGNVWWRFQCMDSRCIEYEQPCFAQQ